MAPSAPLGAIPSCGHLNRLCLTGREDRIPLRLKAEGMGPTLASSFDVLDLGTVFLGSTHAYALQLRNVGAIAAPFRFQVPEATAFATVFSFEPLDGIVPPGQTIAIKVR